ncbi:MAG: glycosyltransferase family 9 protein [Bacteroidota bacterium]
MRILLIALSGIGDALMFTPALKKLKEEFPESQIDALVMFKGVKDIYSNLPYINKVLYHDFLNSPKIKSLLFVLKLRKKYDASINVYPSNRKEYNLINFIIGAEKRAAIKYLRKDFLNLGWLNNLAVQENDELHNVEENIKLCELVTGKSNDRIDPLEIILKDENYKAADKFFKDQNIADEDLTIGFHAGCSMLKNHDKRRWETFKFAELANKLIKEKNAYVLLFGGPEEKYLKDEIKSLTNSDRCIEVETNSLLDAAAVMQQCKVFVSNDSSLMHVAAALKLNIVAIIGPTNKNYIHPWQTNYSIASLELECSPCFYYSPKPLTCSRTDIKFKCIKELGVEKIWELVTEKINE